MIDILRHLVTGLNLGVALYYKDYIDYAEKHGIISRDIANNLRSLIPVRHAIVHRYRSLNYKELWKETANTINTATTFITQVRSFLKKHLKQ